MKTKYYFISLVVLMGLSSCETAEERRDRLEREEKQRIELAERQKEEERLRQEKIEKERIEREKQLEKERIEREERREREIREKEIYDKYINNSLQTGSTPYAYIFGKNQSCSYYGCSDIQVKAPNNSDVIVTIKDINGKVARHTYIRARGTYTFELSNGTWQPFFYYGKGWNPNKEIKGSSGILRGGFIEQESVSKDSPQRLNNNILSYELILQTQGNFRPQSSNLNEAF